MKEDYKEWFHPDIKLYRGTIFYSARMLFRAYNRLLVLIKWDIKLMINKHKLK